MAQAPDRWAAKILALPVFSDAFAKALLQSPYANLALVLSMEVGSAHEFALKVAQWASQLPSEIRAEILTEPFMLEQFWNLATSVEKSFFESTVLQLGFGMCEAPIPPISSDAARARRVGAIKALTDRPSRPPEKAFED
jgi:hypothetical protein